jgi:gamma-glutamylputrescine oxidase
VILKAGFELAHDVKIPVSWYEATALRGEVFAPLRGRVEADVCVIGAGLAGLTTALELGRKGKRVLLLDASRIAAGASGRNGGFVSNGFALGYDGVEARAGVDGAKALYALSKTGTEYVRQQVKAHCPEVLMGEGWRVAVRHDDHGGLKRYGETLAAKTGEVMQHASPSETRMLLDSERYFDSLHFPGAFHIHPLKYALALAQLCLQHNVMIHENCKALGVVKNGGSFSVRTAEGEIVVRDVVHCVSALDRNIHHTTGRALLPVATYIAVTEPLQQTAIKTRSAISDTRRAGDYYRLVDEGRILWGGRITTRVSEPAQLGQDMKGDMVATYPQLGSPRMDYAWAGLMGYALHKMPLIGRDHEGQWFATGFGGHGLNTTAMAGQLLAGAIADGDDRFRRFGVFAPEFAFGPLGRVGVQGSYWWMQAKDRFDEALKR